jgi:enoyl-CoA hydratase/carnithine racemase
MEFSLGRPYDAVNEYRVERCAGAVELATSLVTKNSFALKMAKSALQQADGLDLAAGMRYETLAYTANFSVPHAKAGLNAFLNRRKNRSGT